MSRFYEEHAMLSPELCGLLTLFAFLTLSPFRFDRRSGTVGRGGLLLCQIFAMVPYGIADEPGLHDLSVAALIEQLGSDRFTMRQSAHQQLVEMGTEVRPQLRRATQGTGAEIRQRAKAILREMLGPGVVLYLPNNMRHSINDGEDAAADRLDSRSLSFPDAGSVVFGDCLKLDTDDRFTIMAWIKPRQIIARTWKSAEDQPQESSYPWGRYPASWAGHFIASKWLSVGQNGDFIFAVTPSCHLGLGVGNRSQSKFVFDALETTHPIETDCWTHVAASFQSGRICLYIDGELDCEKQSVTIRHTDRSEYVRDDLHIGGFWNKMRTNEGSLYDFDGRIGELCLFNRALTREEIKSIKRMTGHFLRR